MDQIELRNGLIASLTKMYDMEVIGNLAEFWQGELHVLLYVYQHREAKIYPSDLSGALHVSRARITTTLSALRRKAFITMELCQDDRRRMRVLLTATGESYLKEKQREVEKHFDILMAGLGDANVQELIRLIALSIDVMAKKNLK